MKQLLEYKSSRHSFITGNVVRLRKRFPPRTKARHAAALSQDKVEAPDATMCVTLVLKPSRAKG
jgi:hypothetical protein